MGTVDRRNLMEILKDNEAMQEENTSKQPGIVTEGKYSAVQLYNVFLVSTEKCLNLEAGGNGDCAESKIDSVVSSCYPTNSFTSSGSWSLGRRFRKHLKLPYDFKETLDKREAIKLENMKINFEIPDLEKLCRVYVYCGACLCAINTACTLDSGLPDHIDVVVRIDDRIPTSCRELNSVLSVLEAIRNSIEAQEARPGGLVPRLQLIDSPALERRIYALDQEQDKQVELETMLQKLIDEEFPYWNEDDIPCAGLIVIAETNICSESLNHAPIHSQPRRLRAGELYKFSQSWKDEKLGYDMIFMGRLSRSQAWIDRDKARKDASDLLDEGVSSTSQPNLSTVSRKRPRSNSTTE